MPLIIEDGTIIEGANSYATVAQARAYATARGLSLPTADGAVESALVLACDKLQSYRYKGSQVSPATQPLVWPRSEVYFDGEDTPLDAATIPACLISAQCQFAFEASGGTDLQPTGTGQEVILEKVDVIETHYQPRQSGTVQPEFNKAESILAPILQNGSGLSLRAYRV